MQAMWFIRMIAVMLSRAGSLPLQLWRLQNSSLAGIIVGASLLAMQAMRFIRMISVMLSRAGSLPQELHRHKKAALSGGFFMDQHTDRMLTPSDPLP
ncbi:hypothetical protein SAMN04490201_0319 [Pseudomonas psychrophila]|uniref:Uncharacterized protein n=1 Tax=Pseudomonas psychrophila TaxID=122355 RepID=A0ABY0VE45_9PSED|nr:hypothetical protein SAMN04490201_0319 [Pseudomonas psychrophila]